MLRIKIISRTFTFAFALALISCGGSGPDSECANGELECACLPGNTCDDGLACIDQLCQMPSELGLMVSDARVRSCEVLLREGSSRIVGANFGSSVTGIHLRQGSHSAVSFFANKDAAIAGNAVAVHIVEAAGGPDIQVASVRCFDRDGRALAEATVTLNN